jgi:hypothetical protein
MKLIIAFVALAFLVACSNKDERADAERQKKLENMYKVPPKADRSKNKGY